MRTIDAKECSTWIKRALREAFPDVKFSVRLRRGDPRIKERCNMNREQLFELARLKAAELEAKRKLEAFEKAHEGTFQAAYPRIFDRWLEMVDALERFEQEMEVL
jgi:hypothetical protein